MSTENFSGWCILELMGHRRLAGYVTEAPWPAGFVRLDVPGDDGKTTKASQIYNPSAVYCVTPCDEATARAVAKSCSPAPVQRWELPQLTEPEEAETGGEAHGW